MNKRLAIDKAYASKPNLDRAWTKIKKFRSKALLLALRIIVRSSNSGGG
ncbi:hypothetical protein METHP14_820011 [Pseudomonas sp. P14-2025]